MTLGGLALGVGMMVDGSIVVLENIFRRRQENGEIASVASVEGAREVSGAIIASTITTLVIFLPLIFVRGISGILFKELAYVIIFSLVCSLMVSLSLVPMLASKLLKPPDQVRKTRQGWVSRLVAASGILFLRAQQYIPGSAWLGVESSNDNRFFGRSYPCGKFALAAVYWYRISSAQRRG